MLFVLDISVIFDKNTFVGFLPIFPLLCLHVSVGVGTTFVFKTLWHYPPPGTESVVDTTLDLTEEMRVTPLTDIK
jgi:hypothetical protein